MAEAPQGCRGLQQLLGGVGRGAVRLGGRVPVRRRLVRLKSGQVATAAFARFAVAGFDPPGPAGGGGPSVGARWDGDLHHGRIHFGNDYLRFEDVWPAEAEGIRRREQLTNLINIY